MPEAAPPDPPLWWTAFDDPDPDPCASTVTESPAKLVLPPVPPDGAPGAPTAPEYGKSGVIARAGSSAYSPPLPPAPPVLVPADPAAQHATSAVMHPGGPAKFTLPGVVTVVTDAAGIPANAAQHSNANPPAAVTGCGSGPDRTRAASVADGVNSHDGTVLFCWLAGGGI